MNWLTDISNIIKFMPEAIIAGVLLSISASMVGVILVLKRFSMIGDGLSHVGFGAFSLALAANTFLDAHLNVAIDKTGWEYLVAIPLVIIVAYILLRLGESKKIKGDASIALIASSALAIGYLAINLTGGTSADISKYMFGSITTITTTQMYICCGVAAVVIGLFLCFSNHIFAVTFDESFAKAIGLHTKTFNTILSILTAVIIVFGMRIMGTLLISSIIIFPALTSMKLFNNFKKVVWSSAIISTLCFIIAFFAFYQYSSAASIVIVNLIAFIIATIIGKIIRRFSKK